MIDENKIVRAVSFWFTMVVLTGLNLFFLFNYIPALILLLSRLEVPLTFYILMIPLTILGIITFLANLIVTIVFFFMKKRAIVYTEILTILIIAIFVIPLFIEGKTSRHAIDDGFELNEVFCSPDSNYVALNYCFRTGTLSWTNNWYAVVPYDYEKLDLRDYEIPAGYWPVGWSDNNELILQEGEFYNDPNLERTILKTGDTLYCVKLIVKPYRYRY